MFKKKGIFLIYVLITAILISIFLIGAVENMHNSFFLTNKFTGENKAYWAAESGLQYCEYKLKQNLCYPFYESKTGANTIKAGTEKFGQFTVTSSVENEGKGYFIHGISDDEDEEFCIYFAKQKSEDNLDIVPNSFPSNPQNISYCSYNSINKTNVSSIFQNNDKNLKHYDISFKVSKSPEYNAIITTPGIYVISDGRSKGYRTVLEKMLIADNSNTIGGGIYCGGSIKIAINGSSNRFKVNQTSSSRANVYCKKDLLISRNNEWINAPMTGKTNETLSSIFPFFIGDGTIYLNNLPYRFEIQEANHNGKYHGITTITNNGNVNKENDTFKQQYGVNIEQYKEEFDNIFPKISWQDIQKMKESEKESDNVYELQGGTYCAIKSEDDNNNYLFCYLPLNFLTNDGEQNKNVIADNTANSGLNTLINRSSDKVDRLKHNRRTYVYDKERRKFVPDQEAIEEEKNKLREQLSQFTTSAGCIKYFVEQNKGEILCGVNSSKDMYSIKTVNINTISKAEKDKDTGKIKIEYTTTKTPIITINRSCEVKDSEKGFTLLTLNLKFNKMSEETIENIINSISEDGTTIEYELPNFEYSIADNVSTDLIFNKKSTGLNEPFILTEINKNEKDENKDDEDKLQINNLVACETTNLYSDGPVIINGKLSGTGQILSKKSVYFKAGTQLNTDNFLHNGFGQGKAETSKLGIYSQMAIKMGAPDGDNENNKNELHNKIGYLLAGESGSSIKEMVNKVLFIENKDKKIKVNINDLGRFCTESVLSSDSNRGSTEEALIASIKDDYDQPILLSNLMNKYYGFENREAQDYIQEIIERNCYYDENTKKYRMPDSQDKIKIMTRTSSSFSGVLYACGGFKCDAEETNVVINGAIITYGADPAYYSPGTGSGLGSLSNIEMLNISDFGNIEIYNCQDFSIVYDSTDFAAFVNKISDKPINLSGIYSNKLSL